MTDERTTATSAPPIALVVGGAATLLMLGLPLRSGVVGRGLLPERLFIVAAIVLVVLAGVASTQHLARSMVTGAVAMLGITAAFALSGMSPTGAILLIIAISSLLWQRRLLVPVD